VKGQATPLERAIEEQIAFLQQYLADLRTQRAVETQYLASLPRNVAGDDYMRAALRDPGFQQWMLRRQLEQER
jgi:hypothetical protein